MRSLLLNHGLKLKNVSHCVKHPPHQLQLFAHCKAGQTRRWSSLNCAQVLLGEYHSLEYFAINLQRAKSVHLVIMYWPLKYNCGFMSHFADLLSHICTDYTRIIISGDFNFHTDVSTVPTTVSFNELLQSFDLSQHAMEPTHQHRYTLDLVISLCTDVRISTVNDVALSDHIVFSSMYF